MKYKGIFGVSFFTLKVRSGYGCGNPCCGGGGYGGGYGSGYGASIILVLFILLVIIIGTRAFN